ncbi:MAG: FHA domain-containing protein [Planctomycetales bacterium]|nr:FHA domain-containing protein [Planctomycetales bacterium]
MPSFFVIQGRDRGHRFELDGPASGVGRDMANAIRLHDTEVSRRHAEIRCSAEACELIDLGSSNGTYVNGQRVTRCTLSSGDQVQLGRSLLLYTAGTDPSSIGVDDSVRIVTPTTPDESRILHKLGQGEGEDILPASPDASESPWLARARSNLQVMYRTALAVSHTLDIDELLNRIMELIFEWVEADRGCIMLMDNETEQLEPRVRRNRAGLSDQSKITISKTILDYVTQHNEGVLTSNARDDTRWDTGASILQMNVREAICVPMRGRYGVVGVIYIDTSLTPDKILAPTPHQGGNKFTQEHLKLMVAIAHQAALAVEDTSYYSAMLQAERLAAVGQTIATLSHHIKNILQGIRGGSYLIEMGLSEDDKEVVQKGWHIVEKNQGRISSLVLDMLTFSKEREPELVDADLNETVGDVVELMQVRASELEVALHWSPSADLPHSHFDPEGLHRAVLNLVTNALDACEGVAEGAVHVSTEYDEGAKLFRVVVQDNGSGIPPEQLEKMFTIFVSTKGSRGTGLGLSVSQKICKEHGGQILVNSEVGSGSRFTMEIPWTGPSPKRPEDEGEGEGEHDLPPDLEL